MLNKNKILVIDGTSILVDAYYESLTEEVLNADSEEDKLEAFNTLEKNQNGKYIGAVRGLFSVILDALDRIQPTHVTVVWGTSRKSNVRKEIYSGYKADDNKMDAPLREQFNTAKNMLLPLLKQFTSKKYEAIDLAGTIADKFKDNAEVSILARNNNYLQLADISDVYIKTSRSASMMVEYGVNPDKIPVGFFRYTADNMKYVKDMEPNQILGYSALVGSSSSGIPGVKGIGPAKALLLIKKYSTIDNIYRDIDNIELSELTAQWKSCGVKCTPKSLINDRENAFISRDLLTINKDVYIDSKELGDTKCSVTKLEVARQLHTVGLFIQEPFLEYGGSIESLDFSHLLERGNISNSERSTFLFSTDTSSSFIGTRGEEECDEDYEDSSYSDLSDNDCYSLNFSKTTSTSSSYRNEYYEEDDYVEDDWDYADMSYSDNSYEDDDIDDGGEYCEVITSTSVEDRSENTTEEVLETISLIGTLTLNTYKCNCCGNTFIVQGGIPINFCLSCGAKQTSKAIPKIDNLEDTGCNINDIKVTKHLQETMNI